MLTVETYITPAVFKLPEGVKADSSLKLFAHQELARFCEPYVPASSAAIMSDTAVVTSESVRYSTPYAHYQYVGEVYGPNIPIRENGNIIRWVSPKVKHPTGRKMHYSQQMHPLAQDHWDQAAMAVHKQDLADEIKAFIVERMNGGFG